MNFKRVWERRNIEKPLFDKESSQELDFQGPIIQIKNKLSEP